jgi:hypothetical protein
MFKQQLAKTLCGVGVRCMQALVLTGKLGYCTIAETKGNRR